MKSRLVLLLTVGLIVLTLAHDRSPRTLQNQDAGNGQSHVLPAASKPAAAIPEPAQQRILAQYAKQPMRFEANQGQTDAQVRFLARGSGYTLFLTPAEAVVSLRKSDPAAAKSTAARRLAPRAKPEIAVVRLELVGANPAPRMAGLEELAGRSNYFIGNDPSQWRSNIPSYARVKYEGVYPGVDLIYYGNQRELEHDFIVAPGASPAAITLGVHGARAAKLDARGDVVLRAATGELRLRRPRVYQESNGARELVAARYVLKGQREIGFEVAAYDASKPLIIDPVLSYATYLGGRGDDQGFGIAVDSSGNAYVTGFTSSTNFPSASNAFAGPPFDAFVAKINASGSALSYSTYIGGNGDDEAFGIAVDSNGNAYVTGFTTSTNFPVTGGVVQSSFGGGAHDAFVAKLSSSGMLSYATYLGGSGDDQGFGIAVDSSGNAYVVGATNSTGFATAGAMRTTFGGGTFDAFLVKLNSTGTSKVYATYIGGSGLDEAFGVAVDSSNNAYVAGLTSSSAPGDFKPTPTGAQTTYGGGFADAFVVKVNPAGSAAVYSTFLGGSGDDEAFAIAVDSSGNAYFGGLTGSSSNFPTTAGAFQTAFGGTFDAFVAKLNAAGSSFTYVTYLGGKFGDEVFGIGVDSSGNAAVTGATSSPNFPTSAAAFQKVYGGGPSDIFITKLNASGSALIYSTYLGGSGDDEGNALALDSSGNAYFAGFSTTGGLATGGAAQTVYGGGAHDALVGKVVAVPVVSLSAITPFAAQLVGTTSAAKPVTLTNNGDAVLSSLSISTSGDFGQTNTCGSSLAAGSNCTINVTFAPTQGGLRNGQLTVSSNVAPQNLALSGTGRDFSISVAPTSQSVTAGGSTTYTLTITPLGGFNLAVGLACSGAPSKATCTPASSSVTLDGVNAQNVTVNVTTTAPSMVPPQPQAPPPGSGVRFGLPWLALLAACMIAAAFVAAKRRRVLWVLPAMAALVLLLCIGCAGTPGTPTGASLLTFTGTSGNLSHQATATLNVN